MSYSSKFQPHGHIRKTKDKGDRMMPKSKLQIKQVGVKPTTFDDLSEYSWQRHNQSRPSNGRRFEKRSRKRSVRTWNKRESIRLLDQAVVDEKLDAEQEELARELSGFYDDRYPWFEGRYWDSYNDIYDGTNYQYESMLADDYRYFVDMENDNQMSSDYDEYYDDFYEENEYCDCCGRYYD